MTLQFREVLDSRSKTPQVGGKVRGRRNFKVWDDAGAAVVPDEALVTVGIELFDSWPDDPSLLAVRPGEMRRLEGHNSLVELPWHYENIPLVPPGTLGPDEVGYVEQNTDHRRELVKVYRKQPDLEFPLNGRGEVLAADLTLDIDGTPNDIRGFRQTELIYRSSWVITEIIDHSPSGALYGSFSGKRNSEVFFGGAIGKVVFAGAKSRSIGLSRWAVNHEFFFDEHFHLVQIADRDQDGNIKLASFVSTPPDEEPLTVAELVYWRQPFPELADLHLLSDYFQGVPPGIGNTGRSIA